MIRHCPGKHLPLPLPQVFSLVGEEAGSSAVEDRGQECVHLNVASSQPRPLHSGLQEAEIALGEYRGETSWPAADSGRARPQPLNQADRQPVAQPVQTESLLGGDGGDGGNVEVDILLHCHTHIHPGRHKLVNLAQTHLQETGHEADSPDPLRESDGPPCAGKHRQERPLRDLINLPASVEPDVPDTGEDVEGEWPGRGCPAGLAGVGYDGLVAAGEVGQVVQQGAVLHHQARARHPG